MLRETERLNRGKKRMTGKEGKRERDMKRREREERKVIIGISPFVYQSVREILCGKIRDKNSLRNLWRQHKRKLIQY